MLDKIVLSKDRKSAIVIFDTHSVSFSSDGDVWLLLYEIIFEPIIIRAELLARCEEDTAIIHIEELEKKVS